MCVRHVMGFGEIPDKALSGPMQKLLDGGFIQAVRMIVDKVGLQRRPEGALDAGDRGGDGADRLTDRGRSSRDKSRAASSTGRRSSATKSWCASP